MRRFNDLAIKGKLTVIIMGTTAAALLLACGSFLIYELLAEREIFAQNLSALAEVTGNSVNAALVFHDDSAAKEILNTLRTSPNIAWGVVYKKDGQVFAKYYRDGYKGTPQPCRMQFDGYRFHDNRVELCRAILLHGERLGALSLGSDLGEMLGRIWSYAQIVAIVLFLSLVVAYMISQRLQQVISTPILDLAGLARQVSAERKYSARALKSSQDEIGTLVDGFNAMLSQIEGRDRALQKIQEDLEQRVVQLQHEVAERKRAEAGLAKQTVELQRSNTELEQFAYVASHDLQEPLRMVSSYTQLLAKRYRAKLDAEALEFIDFAVDGVKRMQTLIQDLLQYSRVGTRGKPFAPVDSERVLQTILLNLSAAIRESGAEITHGTLPIVQGDDGQLTQLFQNLVGNAIKYRNEQPPRIHVESTLENGA